MSQSLLCCGAAPGCPKGRFAVGASSVLLVPALPPAVLLLIIPSPLSPAQEEPFSRPWRAPAQPASPVFRGLCGNQSRMDRYRYFIFNQRNMVVLGMFQIAFSTVCVTSGFIDAVFRTESQLGKTRAPIWAGMVSLCCTFYALF